MIEQLMSDYGGRLLIAILGVGIGFLCLIGVLWVMRGRRGPSPFIRGGRNRHPRLQVLDAAAVDTRRRLVLVRRDDVEHLIMIGGPTDIVIESGIPGARRTETSTVVEAPARQGPEPQEQPAPVPSPALAGRPARANRQPVAKHQAQRQGELSETTARPRPQPPAAAEGERSAPTIPVANTSPVALPVEPLTDRREPTLEGAADILDAARNRVFLGPSEPVRHPPSETTAADGPKPLGSDFERILEEEMATNLAARDPAPSQHSDSNTVPPARDERPQVTGATPEPSLQDEMARIFGEMSVTRDR
jgi:hypothetical protein